MMTRPSQTTIIFMMFAVLIGPYAFVLDTNATERSLANDYSTAKQSASSGIAEDLTTTTTTSSIHTTTALSTTPTHTTSPPSTLPLTKISSEPLTTSTPLTLEEESASAPPLSTTQASVPESTTPMLSPSSTMETVTSVNTILTGQTRTSSSTTTSFISTTSSSQQTSSVTKSLTKIKLGQNCTRQMNACDVVNAVCNDANVCVCDDEFYEDFRIETHDSICLPKVNLGENCTNGKHMCKFKHAVCSDSNVCACNDGFDEHTNETTHEKTCFPNCKRPSQKGYNFSVDAETTYGSFVTGITCAEGYSGSQISSVECKADGNWTIASGCTIVDCKRPSQKEYNFPVDAETTYGSSVTGITCAEGYNGSQISSVECKADGNWTIASGCTIVDCQRPSQKGYNFPVDAETTYDSSVTGITCAEGYNGSQISSVECKADGNWTSASGCTTVDCHKPNVTGYSFTTDEGTEFNSSANVSCNIGYSGTPTPSQVKCLAEGDWTNVTGCKKVELPNFQPKIRNKDIKTNMFTVVWISVPDADYDKEIFEINPSMENGTCKMYHARDDYVSEMTITNLHPGTLYTVSMYVSDKKQRSLNHFSMTTYTRPLTPKSANVTDIQEKNATLSWENDPKGIFNETNVAIYETATTLLKFNDTYLANETSIVIYNLTGGTEYRVDVSSVVPGLKSKLLSKKFYTRPQPLDNANLWYSNETDRSFIFHWNKTTSTHIDAYKIDINGGEISRTVSRIQNTSLLFTNLTSGTEYSLRLYTVWYNRSSEVAAVIKLYTKPQPPEGVVATFNATNEIFLKWNALEKEINFMYYNARLWQQNTLHNVTVESIEKNDTTTDYGYKHFINRTPGTKYCVSVSTILKTPGNKSIESSYNPICNYTLPSTVKAESVNGNALNSSTLELSWMPGEGDYSGFDILPDCYNAYSTALQIPVLNSTENNCYINGLAPGSHCNVTITTSAGNQRSNPYHVTLTTRTYEKAPISVSGFKVYNVTNQADTLKTMWDRPAKANGIVRKFYLYIRSQGKCVKKIELDCIDCDGNAPASCKKQDKELNTPKEDDKRYDCGQVELVKNFTQADTSYSYSIKSLQAYTFYIVSIQAFTRCLGADEISTPVRTDEDVPNEPQNLSAKSVGTDEIVLQWNLPSPVTGIIEKYEINYSYKIVTCGSGGPLTNTTKTVNGSQRIEQLTQLHPYWSYSIRIRAATSKGFGPFSNGSEIQTNESAPGKIENTTLVARTESYSLEIRWDTPCYSNGIIIGYDVQRINQNDSTDAKNDSVSPNDTFLNVTEGILPYRNYTIKVRARTRAAAGNFTRKENVQTKAAVPHQPANVTGSAVSSKSMNVSWEPPNLYTGITNYMVEARDSKDHSFVRSCSSSGFLSTACVVDQLDEYWDYTLRVTASTVAGNTSTTFTHTFRTQEDKPGEVAQFNLVPQTDIKLERSINVSWEQPMPRDLNGIIINYTIEYMVNGANYTIDINNNHTFLYELKGNIKPGSITVQIVAATSKGYGKPSEKTTVVKAGAVLKPNETVQQLVQPSLMKVKEKERQIAVTLQLQSFMCNNNNGEPTQWGVVVAQDELAQDTPFFGTFQEYRERLKMYKHWSEIKDADVIPPYKATKNQWSPCSSFRKRRSAGHETDTTSSFVVGKDGDCAGTSSDEYCNGQLQPGRSYRVKSFVCTEGGCTESKYSQPIKTAPDLTVPIVAGVVSGIVVVAAILVVVFLKRRGKVCFAKDIEQHATFERPESLELTKSSKFRPRSIKLADFPAFVENMQKDSGLLFADAFRLLKDQSPSHPCATAETQACRLKTRYTNILPFDHSRTKLLPLDDEEGSDFINANYIPGYTSRREYIASQGPLPATKDDFWRMVWEQRVDIIVMLTRCIEKGKRKCDQYWPEVVQEPVYSGDLIINIQSESVLSDYIIRIIEVKLKDESRLVRHLAFQKWPDMGSPDETDMLLNFVKAVRQFRPPNSKCPMVVHCSAGVGRTGTFIAVDHILQHIRDHDEVDVYSIILDMRNYRCNMVQTEDQFVYIHECVRDFITMDEQDDEEEEEEHLYENTSGRENIYENTAFQQD